ncbi:Hypothetical predicted protein [Paramuricea clavata]|uniref:Uncharacterized protein n=1 Tax=Paramuricea clavata TaxID=317549 RepID=A0A7D9IVQ1_PARCT|nr:Hypothetical predicted protein [Paramuricea clavata]
MYTMTLNYYGYGVDGEVPRQSNDLHIKIFLKENCVCTNIDVRASFGRGKMKEDMADFVCDMLAYDVVRDIDDLQTSWIDNYRVAVNDTVLYEFDDIVKDLYNSL